MAGSTPHRLAPYAVVPGQADDRAHAEPPASLFGAFEQDRYRIIQSTAFRRLEGKTQVFAPGFHDHFRTRLTHTLEVAQIARTLAVALQANEQLAEAIALAHDLGHPPFGHAGEAALDEAMTDHGGFNHNAHVLRVVEYLEHPFPAFRGLNLTVATRAGLAAHQTRYDRPATRSDAESTTAQGASVEARIASVADRIAYDHHDLEDAIGAGFLKLGELESVALWQRAFETVSEANAAPNIHAVRRGVLNAMLDEVLQDVVDTSRKLLSTVESPEAAAAQEHPLVAASHETERRLRDLEQFLAHRLYRRPEVADVDTRNRERVVALFEAYRRRPELLPRRFSARIDEQGLNTVICDYLAGMTDRYFANQYDSCVST